MASTALIATWVLLVLFTLGVHGSYVAALRREYPAVNRAIGEPPLLAYRGMFALGDNRGYWRHLFRGPHSESLRVGLQRQRRLLAVLFIAHVPVAAGLIISIALT